MVNGVTTGGAANQTVTVSDAVSLISYATTSSPYVIKVPGTITLSNRLDVASHKTIIGINSGSTNNGNLTLTTSVVIARYSRGTM